MVLRQAKRQVDYLYKLEGEPKGVSIEQFCIKQGVPYQVFNKWFRDRKKRIVPVEIVGRDEDSKPEVEAEEKKAEGPKRASCVKYVKLVFGNELRIEKKNLSYHELKELVDVGNQQIKCLKICICAKIFVPLQSKIKAWN